MDETPQPPTLVCPQCHVPITAQQYFCSNCGKNLQEAPLVISLAKQLGIYALSIFLPPLGFYPGFRYVMKKDPAVRRVGIIAIVLSVIATVVTVWAIFVMFQDYMNQLNAVLQ